jgi:hypothetical protein
MIGIPAEVGTPPQNLVLLPWAYVRKCTSAV